MGQESGFYPAGLREPTSILGKTRKPVRPNPPKCQLSGIEEKEQDKQEEPEKQTGWTQEEIETVDDAWMIKVILVMEMFLKEPHPSA